MSKSTSHDNHPQRQKTVLTPFETPTLLMQSAPRQVVTANKKACELFGKNVSQMEGQKGGQVFDCVHSYTEDGCGKDHNCEKCKIKNAVIETFSTGKAHFGVQTVLDIKRHDKITPYNMNVSTERAGDFVLVSISRYEKKA